MAEIRSGRSLAVSSRVRVSTQHLSVLLTRTTGHLAMTRAATVDARFDAVGDAAGKEFEELDSFVIDKVSDLKFADQPKLQFALDVPEGHTVVAVSKDDEGIFRLHHPAPERAGTASTRGGSYAVKIEIPFERAPANAVGGTRSIVGWIAKKLVRFFVTRVAKALGSLVGGALVRAWEASHRPHQLVALSSDGATWNPGVDAATAFQGWSHKRALLFVHGTFSSTQGAFEKLPTAVRHELQTRYGNRVIGFDHPTLTQEPEKNVAELIAMLQSAGVSDTTFDIVSHSRGGLVSRSFARALSTGAQGRIKTLVAVATPNCGTPLASPENLSTWLDLLLNVGSLGGTIDILESIFAIAKAGIEGLRSSLVGLDCMDPKGAWLKDFSTDAALPVRYAGLAANFEPAANDSLFVRALNRVADRAFSNDENDLVVPTEGVGKIGNTAWQNLVRLQETDVQHTTFFGNSTVQTTLLDWLQ